MEKSSGNQLQSDETFGIQFKGQGGTEQGGTRLEFRLRPNDSKLYMRGESAPIEEMLIANVCMISGFVSST
jgi:hypothetical protein